MLLSVDGWWYSELLCSVHKQYIESWIVYIPNTPWDAYKQYLKQINRFHVRATSSVLLHVHEMGQLSSTEYCLRHTGATRTPWIKTKCNYYSKCYIHEYEARIVERFAFNPWLFIKDMTSCESTYGNITYWSVYTKAIIEFRHRYCITPFPQQVQCTNHLHTSGLSNLAAGRASDFEDILWVRWR